MDKIQVSWLKFLVIVTRRPKDVFVSENDVIKAAALAHIVEGGILTEALLAISTSVSMLTACIFSLVGELWADKVELDHKLRPIDVQARVVA